MKSRHLFFEKKTITEILINLLLFLPLINIPQYVFGKTVYSILDYYYPIACLIMLARGIKNGVNKNTVIAGIAAILIYLPSLILAIGNGYSSSVLSGAKIIMGLFSFIVYYGAMSRRNARITLLSLIIYLGLLVCANVATFFIFYPSMTKLDLSFYLLGNDNGSIFEVYVFIFLLVYYRDKYYGNISKKLIIVIVAIVGGYFYVKSGNGMLFGLLMLLFAIFYKKIKRTPIKTVVVLYVLITGLVVLSANSNVLSPVLCSMGKSETISGRTDIWSRSVKNFMGKPIFGTGFEPAGVSTRKILINKTHNMPLQMLYTGGVYMLVFYIVIFIRLICIVRGSPLSDSQKTIILVSLLFQLYIGIMDFYIFKITTGLLLSIWYLEAKTAMERKIKNGE